CTESHRVAPGWAVGTRKDLKPYLSECLGSVLRHDVDASFDGGREALPGVGEALVQFLAAPVAGALAHLVWREEDGCARGGQCFRAGLLLAGDTKDSLVHQLVAKVVAELCAHVGSA